MPVSKHTLKITATGASTTDYPWEDILGAKIEDTGLYRWKTIVLSASSSKHGALRQPEFAQFKDNGAGSTGIYLDWFDSSIEEEIHSFIRAPYDWAEGTPVYIDILWVPAVDGGAGEKVSWGIETAQTLIGGDFPSTAFVYGDEHAPVEALKAGRLYRTVLFADPETGITINSARIIRIFRDATGAGGTDDYAGDAGLVSLEFHYQVDALGAAEKYSKD